MQNLKDLSIFFLSILVISVISYLNKVLNYKWIL